MRHLVLAAVSVFALVACAPQTPDRGAGVGFGDYNSYQQQQATVLAQREAQLSGTVTVRPPELDGATPGPVVTAGDGVNSADLAAAGIGAAPRPAVVTPPPAGNALITPAPGTSLSPAAAPYTGVAAAQSQPPAQPFTAQPVPGRPENVGPDIVAYALSTQNPVGVQAYQRTLPSQSRAERNCARFGTSDAAQRAFLAAGGPQKDKHGIDPDGDGYACSWNPEPFRRAVGR